MHRYPLLMRQFTFVPQSQRFRHILIDSFSLIVSCYSVLCNEPLTRISQYSLMNIIITISLVAKDASVQISYLILFRANIGFRTGLHEMQR